MGDLTKSHRTHGPSAAAHDHDVGSVGKQTQVQTSAGALPSSSPEFAIAVIDAAKQILLEPKRTGLLHHAPPRAYGTLMQLHSALTGQSVFYPGGVTSARRLEMFDTARRALAPCAKVVAAQGDELNTDLSDEFTRLMDAKRPDLAIEATKQRVDDAMLAPDKHTVIEVPDGPLDDDNAAAYGTVLASTMRALITTTSRLSLMAQTLKIEHHRLGRTAASLELIAGGLALPHAVHELRDAEGRRERVESYTELVKTALEATKGGIEVAAQVATAIAKKTCKDALVKQISSFYKFGELGEQVGTKLGGIIGAVEAIHGFALLCDPSADLNELLDGSVEIGGGALTTLGALGEEAALGGAGALIGAGYALWKLDMSLHAKIETDLAEGDLRPRLDTIAGLSTGIREASDFLIKAQLLIAHEPDPGRNAALALAVVNATTALDDAVDGLLGACSRGRRELWMPGGNEALARRFDSVQKLGQSSVGPDAALRKATRVLQAVNDAFADYANIVRESRGLDAKPPD